MLFLQFLDVLGVTSFDKSVVLFRPNSSHVAWGTLVGYYIRKDFLSQIEIYARVVQGLYDLVLLRTLPAFYVGFDPSVDVPDILVIGLVLP